VLINPVVYSKSFGIKPKGCFQILPSVFSLRVTIFRILLLISIFLPSVGNALSCSSAYESLMSLSPQKYLVIHLLRSIFCSSKLSSKTNFHLVNSSNLFESFIPRYHLYFFEFLNSSYRFFLSFSIFSFSSNDFSKSLCSEEARYFSSLR